MGIYSNPTVSFKPEIAKLFLLIIVVAVILFAAYFVGSSVLAEKPLEAKFEFNPWNPLENRTNTLSVKVVNTTKENATDIVVEVVPKALESISVSPSKEKIFETLAPGDSRTIQFVVTPRTENVLLPGNYTIDFKLSIDSQTFLSQEILKVVNE